MIMIVEHNPINLKLMQAVLSVAGHSVITATNREEVLQWLCTIRPELILMDMQLKDNKSLELIRRIKADPATKDIKIIAVTRDWSKDDEVQALAAGCAGYITKQISTRTLPLFVADLLNRIET